MRNKKFKEVKMFEIDCQKCGEMAIIFTVDLERNDVLTCDECSEVILILDNECRTQLGLKTLERERNNG